MDLTDEAAKALFSELTPTSPSAAPGQHMLPSEARCDVGGIPVWRAHTGPATLFVHGWNDTHRIWRQFAQDFIANLRPVLLMDLPGHGASQSSRYDRGYAGEAVYTVCKEEAPIDTIIAHSFGCVATAMALKSGARADYVILIAPPMRGWIEIKKRSGVEPAVLERVVEMAKETGGGEIEPFDFVEALSGYDGNLLLIGSDSDIVSPPHDIGRLAEALPNAQAHSLAGLGHRELCLNADVLSRIVQFLGYT